MRLSVKLVDTDSQIVNKTLQALLPDITKTFNNVVKSVNDNIKIILRSRIQNTPEYDSLINGQLKYEFGLINPVGKINNIIQMWINNIEVKVDRPRIVNQKIRGSFGLRAIKRDYSDVINTLSATQFTDNGQILDWLRWLLLEGNRYIVRNYKIQYNPKYSRTGTNIMVQSSSSWRVPNVYSGTINDNWITRALETIDQDIETVIIDALNR